MQRLISFPTFGRFQRLSSTIIRFCSQSTNEMNLSSPTNSVDSVRLDREMLSKLERLAALRFKSVEEVEALREEICLANRIFEVDTTGVEPLYSIVEELIDCPLREDEPVVPDKQQIFANSSEQVEGFFVSPAANIPLKENQLFAEISNKT